MLILNYVVPKTSQLTIWTDMFLMPVFLMQQSWALFGFMVVSKPITILFEYLMFYIFPFWDVPFIEWGKMLGVETIEDYEWQDQQIQAVMGVDRLL